MYNIYNTLQLSNTVCLFSVDKFRCRWKTSRDAYMRCKMKGKAGSTSAKSTKYLYHEQMQFLEEISQRPSASSYFDAPATRDDLPSAYQSDDDVRQTDTIVTQDKGEMDQARTNKELAKKGHKSYHFGVKLLALLETIKDRENDADRSFLLSMLPHVHSFNDDQKLLFQSEVVQLIMRIKRGIVAPVTSPPSSSNFTGLAHPQCSQYQHHGISQPNCAQHNQNPDHSPASHFIKVESNLSISDEPVSPASME